MMTPHHLWTLFSYLVVPGQLGTLESKAPPLENLQACESLQGGRGASESVMLFFSSFTFLGEINGIFDGLSWGFHQGIKCCYNFLQYFLSFVHRFWDQY